MSIKENMRVKVATTDPFFTEVNGQVAKIVRVYESMGIAIVRFKNSQVVKIPVDYLVEIEQRDENQETKITEDAKRITKVEFIKAVHDVTSPDGSFGRVAAEVNPLFGMLGGMSVMIVGMKIADRIFKDQEFVTITEDQLTQAIWDNCSPAKLAESSNMSVRKCMRISLLSINALDNLIEIFFGDDSDNA